MISIEVVQHSYFNFYIKRRDSGGNLDILFSSEADFFKDNNHLMSQSAKENKLMQTKFRGILFVVVWLGGALFPEAAFAYVGPGAGLSVLGVLFSLIAAFFLGIVGFIWYPIRRFLRNKRRLERAGVQTTDQQQTSSPQSSKD